MLFSKQQKITKCLCMPWHFFFLLDILFCNSVFRIFRIELYSMNINKSKHLRNGCYSTLELNAYPSQPSVLDGWICHNWSMRKIHLMNNLLLKQHIQINNRHDERTFNQRVVTAGQCLFIRSLRLIGHLPRRLLERWAQILPKSIQFHLCKKKARCCL